MTTILNPYGPQHGMSYTRVYRVWQGIVKRCTNPSDVNYPLYGGRGINVCSSWLKFVNFYRDMGDPPEGKSIERDDNGGDYCPENCRWATLKEQNRNKRNNHRVVVNGLTLTIAEWALRSGLTHPLITSRLKRGWPPELAVTKQRMKHRYDKTEAMKQ